MSARIQELDFASTPMGDISLRRRRHPALDVDVYEVKLGDEFLMSSLYTVAEIALAELGLAATDAPELDVVVGGLGLGCTARAALRDPRVRSSTVVEALPQVVEWHRRRLLPYAADLVTDPRSRLLQGDFFALVAAGSLGAGVPDPVHAVLLDIDHTPRHVLHPSHAAFYTAEGLRLLAERLHPGGVFALWSDEAPDPAFLDVLRQVFGGVEGHVVPFANPVTGGESTNGIYVCVR